MWISPVLYPVPATQELPEARHVPKAEIVSLYIVDISLFFNIPDAKFTF